MAVHVATLTMVNVDRTGNIVIKDEATCMQVAQSSSEIRVMPDDAIPNTTGYPTVKQYLELEDADSYELRHLDQTYVITYEI